MRKPGAIAFILFCLILSGCSKAPETAPQQTAASTGQTNAAGGRKRFEGEGKDREDDRQWIEHHHS